jgi:hypothetical protein
VRLGDAAVSTPVDAVLQLGHQQRRQEQQAALALADCLGGHGGGPIGDAGQAELAAG